MITIGDSVTVTVERSNLTRGVYCGYNTPWGACVNWCHATFPSTLHWTYTGDGVFEFTDERMATAFLLRWS